nr:ferric reductase-like transmembrane domain-containing protein [Sinorhizobium meliloti]
MLLVTLFITPARRIFRWKRVNVVRRMIGVGALGYTVAHLICYFWMRFFDPAFIITETTTRVSLIVATVSFVGLLALGVASLDATIKWFGAKDWGRLHGSVYVLTGLAVFHFVLSPGAYGGLPFLMLGVYFWLMAWRFFDRRRQGESIGVLAGLTVAATLLTVVSEILWPAIIFEMDPWVSLLWNFNFEVGVSPGWMVLGLATAVTIGAAIRQRMLLPIVNEKTSP